MQAEWFSQEEDYPQQHPENSINLLREAYEEYQQISPIREVITDYGTQFYANLRDARGEEGTCI